MADIDTEAAQYDIVIIGGGINGAGIARDAALRGAKVYLCEKDDFAAHTSSWSTKLIHGGLRYLEYYEFRLVREALNEREVLMRLAPHLIKPMRFILPHHKGLRPRWLLRLGLFLYDHLGVRKSLAGTKTINLVSHEFGDCLSDTFKTGFEYSDCQVDDSRLVIENIKDAHRHGACIEKGVKCLSLERDRFWNVGLQTASGQEKSITSKIVVNAAGPWVNNVLAGAKGVKPRKNLRLVKGSHIITNKLYPHDRAYIFQNADGRIVFAIPYLNDTTLIGTTDIVYDGDPANAAISCEEIDYLCASISEYFAKPVNPDDVISTFSGVRPLFDALDKKEATAVTRDYAFDIDVDINNDLPLLSVYGGKLTTYRKLADHALRKLEEWGQGWKPSMSKTTPLIGGEINDKDWDNYQAALINTWPNLPRSLMNRLINTYGSEVPNVIGNAQTIAELGQHFGADLYQCELDYLVRREWVSTANDATTRRTKLDPLLSKTQKTEINEYINRLVLS